MVSSALLAIAYALLTSAFTNSEARSTHTTHRTRDIRREFRVEAYHPASRFKPSSGLETDIVLDSRAYKSPNATVEVHRIGEVWANMVHNVYTALVGAHGWCVTAKTNLDGTGGNDVFLHLFLDALHLRPCNPTMASARAAWIQADVNRYNGANKCRQHHLPSFIDALHLQPCNPTMAFARAVWIQADANRCNGANNLWKAFASRGLGVGAANYVDSFTVPSEC